MSKLTVYQMASAQRVEIVGNPFFGPARTTAYECGTVENSENRFDAPAAALSMNGRRHG